MNKTEAVKRIKADVSCKNYLQKASKGGYICPYCGSGTHEHHTGALQVNQDNTFHCYACGMHGDVISLYEQVHGVSFTDAVNQLSEVAGITIDASEATETPQNEAKALSRQNYATGDRNALNGLESAKNGKRDFSEYFLKCERRLCYDKAAQEYLQNRGISPEVCSKYHLGYDPAYKTDGQPRIILPVSNSFYVARAINSDVQPKTMNPAGGTVEIFNESALQVSTADAVFIVEGIFDALSFIECGYEAVALNSKKNGKKLLELLRQKQREGKPFIIVPDNDTGETENDTIKEAEKLKAGITVLNRRAIVCHLPERFHDANDALQKDRDALKEYAEQAIKEAKKDDLDAFMERITGTAYKPHTTGIEFLDSLLSGGIINETLTLILAMPGTGKTTLIQQMCEAMAERGQPIIYLNFEMSKEQMIAKAISSRLSARGITESATRILQGYNWTDQERQVIAEEIEKYRESTFSHIQYKGLVSADIEDVQVFLQMQSYQAKLEHRTAPAIAFDYVQLASSSKGLDAKEIVKQVLTALKQYAVENHTFCIGISATNRNSNQQGRITLNSGRDTSSIEYTGDTVISLNYADIEDGKADADKPEDMAKLQEAKETSGYRVMSLRVLKSRFSMAGKRVTAYFYPQGTRYFSESEYYRRTGRTEAERGAIALQKHEFIL